MLRAALLIVSLLMPSGTAPGRDPAAGAGIDSLIPDIGNAGLDVQHYDVDLRIAPGGASFDGVVSLTIRATDTLNVVRLDAVGLDVSAVTVNGTAAPYSVATDKLIITPDRPVRAGQRVLVAVTYRFAHSDAPVASSHGPVPLGWFVTDRGTYVLDEPDGARTWLPVNDHPSDKATWRFRLTVPAGQEAIANGELVSHQSAADHDVWIWRMPDPMSTYVVQLLSGQYDVFHGHVPDGPRLSSVALPGHAELIAECHALTIEQLAFFQPLFGPYPFGQYGLAIVPSVTGLAMETQTRSQFSDQDLTSCATGDYIGQLLTSHELAHQWFGDAVTLGDWKDIWLNEAFATYGQWLWFEHIGQASVDQQAEVAMLARTQRATATPTVDDMFGTNTYDGGAVILQALRRTIGDDAFFEVLRRWVHDNRGQSRRTADFIALAERVGGRDLSTFFDDWLFAAQVPDALPAPAING